MEKKKKFRDRSLRYKIGVMTLLVAVIPLLIFYITITVLYNHAFEERSNQQIKENLTVMSDRIEKIFLDSQLCSNYITLNLNSINNEVAPHQVDKDNLINSILNQTILIFDGIDSMVYIDKNQNMYSTNYNLFSKKDEIMNSEYMTQLSEIKNGKSILFDYKTDCMMRDENSPVVTMGKRIIQIKSGETLGFLFINIDVEQLESSMQNEITNYFLFDKEGNAVANMQQPINMDLDSLWEIVERDEAAAKEMTIVRNKGTRYIIGTIGIPTYHWSLMGVTNLSSYNVSMTQLIRILLMAGIITAVLLIALCLALTKMITNPLKDLKDGAEEIANGNLDVEFRFRTNDEIGRLGSIFNHMTKEISELFQKVDEEAKKKTEYELALVQEQVKPHFLYNTLDIIIMLIEMNKSREAVRVTKKLADYYKNSLSSSVEIIPLEKELRILEDYLDLQLMRYKDKFSYNITMDESLSTVLIPKMTLQPLVENAIYHGLKYKEDWGTISVSAQLEHDIAVIKVQDDGVGMNEESIERVMKLSDKAENHFGVYSVKHRLKLYYGELCEMKVISKEGEGTTFTICFPIDWKEKEHA